MTHPFMPKCAMLNGIQISATSIADPARFICKDILKQSSSNGTMKNKGADCAFVHLKAFTEQTHP